MSIAEFSIKNRLIAFIVIVGVLLAGWSAYSGMPRFEDPEFTIREAVVVTQYPGASPEEVANEVTEALEAQIQQLQEVDEIRSLSTAGVSRINVEIKYEFSKDKEQLQQVWGKLRNKVKDAQASLPPGVSESVVNDDFGDVYGLYFAITGDGFSSKELYEYARELRTQMLGVPDVAKASILGEQREAIYVEVSRARASAMGLSVDKIYGDLKEQNSVVSAGEATLDGRRLVVRPAGAPDSVEALRNVVISTAEDGTTVQLKNVAEVTRGYAEPQTLLVRYAGRDALVIGVSGVSGTNVVAMGEGIDALLAQESALRPAGIEVHEFFHQGKLVNTAVSDFALNVVAALVIVLLTLLVFMGFRSALVIAGILVLTVAATLTTMELSGIPMHRISLGALIIALGMLVDNAIVVTEGILVGVKQGRTKLAVAVDVVRRTKWPLLGGTLVGIIAFAPIGFAPGSTAEYTGHLFWVVLISLLYSWLFAMTAVPLFADLLFKEKENTEKENAEGWFYRGYRRMMAQVLRHRWVVVGLAFSLFAASAWSFKFIKPGFFPASTAPQMVVDYWLPEGTDFDTTRKDMLELESWLSEQEHVEGVHTLVGQGGLRFTLVYQPESPNVSYGQFLVKVDDYKNIDKLMPLVQEHIEKNQPDAQAKAWRFQLGPGGGSKLEAVFSGPDPDVLRGLADKATSIMQGKATAIKNDWRQTVPVLEPHYSEDVGRRLGVSRKAMAEALEQNFKGTAVGVYREGRDMVPIVARAPAADRQDVENLGMIPVPSATSGESVPLSEVVTSFETVWRDAQLRREDRVWTIKAQADPLPGELASSLQARVGPLIEEIELPDGYSFRWDGEKGDSEEAQGDLAGAVPFGFLAMVLVVVFLFNRVRQPLVIWLAVPLALIGVVVGLLATGLPMEFMAILGLLSLSGLLIKNAIVLVDQMDVEIREGKDPYNAVIDSATSRVRAVSMGAVTTVLGVLPLFADAFFKSMTVVIAFGLTFATVLTLIVVPALYAIFFKVSVPEAHTSEGEAS